MIKIIGKKGCSACMMAKKVLQRNKVEFDYLGLDEMTNEEQSNWIVKAREKGISSLPFILKDDKFVELKEVSK